MEDKHNLQRFLDAQQNSIVSALDELHQGQKRGHWMWYIFAQVKGLGQSPTSKLYAIGSTAEASAYLKHPVLGTRLIECTEVVNTHRGRTAEQIFGYPDYLKFRSCMTLFDKIAGRNNPFSKALTIFYAGEPDLQTLSILRTL